MTRGLFSPLTQPIFIMSASPLFFAGIDWGSRSHQACVLAPDGAVLGEKTFLHSGQGLGELLDWMVTCAGCDAEHIAVALEIPHGPIVDSLLDRGFQVSSINPKQLDRFRDRFSPAGAKDDRRDARVLADAVRTDPDCLRVLNPVDREMVQLREWSRIADELTTQRTQLTNRLREQLWRYYPQFLQLKRTLYAPWVLALWKLVPTPAKARRVRKTTVAKVLKKHRIRRITAEEVLELLQAKPVTAAPGVVDAATGHIRLLVQQLTVVNQQLSEVKRAMADLLEELSDEPPEQDTPPDAVILRSLPGVGPAVAATLLSEAAALLVARDYAALRCLCGVAPVTRQSGRSRHVVRRRASQRRLVNAVYHWSRTAIQHDPVRRAKYDALRARGHSHGRALRSVADRLLAVACAMLRTGTLFDPHHATAAARAAAIRPDGRP